MDLSHIEGRSIGIAGFRRPQNDPHNFEEPGFAGDNRRTSQRICYGVAPHMESMTSLADKGDDSDKHAVEDRVGTVMLFGVPIVCLFIDNKERLCLAQISNTILRDFSYNEIHNRRVALGITCMQCSPSQLEILRRTGAMPVSSRRCGLITKREAERLVKSFVEEIPPPRLPEDFTFKVSHNCGWGSKGLFIPSRYNSSRAKCIKCLSCDTYFSPNKFIFHYHKVIGAEYKHPDAANFNSWRRHLVLADDKPSESLLHAWEDVKAMFNGGCRKRFSSGSRSSAFMSRSDLDNQTEACSRRGNGNPYPFPGYSSFLPPTNVPQPPFSNPMFGRITSYGDFLRSLSMPYNNPWPGKLDLSSSLNLQSPVTKNDHYGFPAPNVLPLNIPYPTPRDAWSDPHILPTPSPITHISASSSQPCFPEKITFSISGSNAECSGKDSTRDDASPAKQARVCTPEPDSSIDVEREDGDSGDGEGDKTGPVRPAEPSKEENSEGEKSSRADLELDCTWVLDDILDENIDIKDLQTVPIDTLRAAVAKAITQRQNAEKDKKKMQNMLKLRALKELEQREEFARQFCSVKESIWSEIEQERATKGSLEERLKDTRQLLQRLSRNTPDTVFLPTCE